MPTTAVAGHQKWLCGPSRRRRFFHLDLSLFFGDSWRKMGGSLFGHFPLFAFIFAYCSTGRTLAFCTYSTCGTTTMPTTCSHSIPLGSAQVKSIVVGYCRHHHQYHQHQRPSYSAGVWGHHLGWCCYPANIVIFQESSATEED